MKNKERIQKLKEALERIVKTSEEVSSLMGKLPHSKGIAYRSLKHRGGEYITHIENSFSSIYKSKDGEKYQITITKKIK